MTRAQASRAAVSAIGIAFAGVSQADPVTLFGRLDAAIESAELDAPVGALARRTRVSNYRSIAGVRGEEALDEELRAIWQLSFSFPLDAAPPSIPLRDSRIGFSGRGGTAFIGAWFTPYALSILRLDPFVLTTADLSAIIGNGNAPIGANTDLTQAFIRRQSNSVNYHSPSWNGIQLRTSYGANEERNGSRDPWLGSASLSWESSATYVAVAMDVHNAYQASNTRDRGVVFAAQQRFGGVQVGLVMERLRYETRTGPLQRDAWFLSLVLPAGPGAIQATYTRARDATGASTELVGGIRAGASTGATHINLGYEYAFSRRTRVQVFVSRLANDSRAAYEYGNNTLGRVPGSTTKIAALGMRHDF